MNRLFELFVARWLEKNLNGERYSVQCQEEVQIDSLLNINFKIDLSILDRESGSCTFVLDTKYKVGNPSAGDIEQVAAYAEAKGYREAILVYPEYSNIRLSGQSRRHQSKERYIPSFRGPRPSWTEIRQRIIGIGY
jgi:5-methylcytosine-specific restriction endonuclease McrBC regulatory subunit McrC